MLEKPGWTASNLTQNRRGSALGASGWRASNVEEVSATAEVDAGGWRASNVADVSGAECVTTRKAGFGGLMNMMGFLGSGSSASRASAEPEATEQNWVQRKTETNEV